MADIDRKNHEVESTGRREDEAPADEPTDAAAAAAAAAFIADVLPSRALRDVGAQILAKDAEDPDRFSV